MLFSTIHKLVLLILILQIFVWKADAWFALAGLVKVQAVCTQSSIWVPTPSTVRNLCLQCYCIRAAFSLSLCSTIPNYYVNVTSGLCVPFTGNVGLFPILPTTTTIAPPTTLFPPIIQPFPAPAVAGAGAIFPGIPGLPPGVGVAGAGQILPARPGVAPGVGVAGAGQILPATPVAQVGQGLFPGFPSGSINGLGGVPATFSPGGGLFGLGFTAPFPNVNALQGKKKKK